MIKWSNRLATHIEMVDSHHKRIIDLISAFAIAFANEGPDRDLVESALKALAERSRNHFAEEEALMHFCGVDPRHIDAHTHEHRIFIDDIEQLAAQMDVASSERVVEISEQLVRFMTAWLVLHVVSMDQAMASQIAAIESGSSAAAAYSRLHSDLHAATSSRMLLHSVLDLWRDSFDECRRLEARLAALTPRASSGVQLPRWTLPGEPASPISGPKPAPVKSNGHAPAHVAFG